MTIRTLTLLAAAALILAAAPPLPAQSPDGPRPVPYGLSLLEAEEEALVEIVRDGPGPGSPDHRAALVRYRAIQAFLRLAQTPGRTDRYRVEALDTEGSARAVDTVTGEPLLESADGRLTYYSPSLLTREGEDGNGREGRP